MNSSFKLKLLQILPILLTLALIFSTMALHFSEHDWNTGWLSLIQIISISGLIGFLTNWLAISMLFFPTTRRPLFGQGLIPAQKTVIAGKLATSVHKNLINSSHIRQKILAAGLLDQLVDQVQQNLYRLTEQSDFRERIYNYITTGAGHILGDDSFREQLATDLLNHLETSMKDSPIEYTAFRTYRRLREEHARKILSNTLARIPETLHQNRNQFDDMLEGLPSRLDNHKLDIQEYLLKALDELLDRIDIRSMMTDNLNRYDEGRLEQLIRESTSEQLSYIKYLGALLGMAGGLFIWDFYLASSVFLLGGGLLWGTDVFLQRMQASDSNRIA